MMNDISFCCVATEAVLLEAMLWLKSVRLFQGKCLVVVGCDRAVAAHLEGLKDPNLEVFPVVADQPFNIDRVGYDKANTIAHAMRLSRATIYNDVDVMMVGDCEFKPIVSGFQNIILSPHFCKDEIENKYGHFNSGCLGCSDRSFPQWWIDHLNTNKLYGDQQLLDFIIDPAEKFNFRLFEENHNVGWWREMHSRDGMPVEKAMSVNGTDILWRGKPTITVHTHLIQMPPYIPSNNALCTKFNRRLIECMKASKDKRHAELLAEMKALNV